MLRYMRTMCCRILCPHYICSVIEKDLNKYFPKVSHTHHEISKTMKLKSNYVFEHNTFLSVTIKFRIIYITA